MFELWYSSGQPGAGLVSKTCGLAAQIGCQGVCQDGGAELPMSKCVETITKKESEQRSPAIAGR